jgi:AcrR family transcriptional regulator
MSGKAGAAEKPRRVRLDHDERRRQILAIARQLFSESNYGAVSMDDVARKAGVTRGLLHHYFGGKRELYVDVVREMFRGTGAQPPVPEYVEGVSVEERVAESVDRWMQMVESNTETFMAMLGAEGLGKDPEIEELVERVRERAVDNIIEVLGVGPVASAPKELRAVLRGFGGLAEATAREWLGYKRLTREQTHKFLTTTLLKVVREVLPEL